MNKAIRNIVPAGHIYVRDNILEKGSLTGVDESKAAWAKDLHLAERAEYTFFAGCGYQHMKYVEGMMKALKSAEKMGMGMGRVMGIGKVFSKVGIDIASIAAKITASKDDPYTNVLRKAVSVLRKLGVDVGYLGEKEPCCGSPLYYDGFEDDYAGHVRKNYEIFKSSGVKKIIGLVPACTSALKNVYPKYIEGYNVQVQHFFEVVARRLKETGIRPTVKEKIKITYHEPCQLSRYLELVSEVREVLQRIEGLEVVEPDAEQCGMWSTCCGGGGLEASHPELAERIGLRRAEELLETGASVFISSCPACEMQLAKATKKLHSNIRVMDLVEVLDQALQ